MKFDKAHEILIKSLYYPFYARPNFFINEQKKSEWNKGVFLQNLIEALQYFRISLQITKRALRKNSSPVPEIFLQVAIEGKGILQVSEKTLKELHRSIEIAWKMDAPKRKYSAIETLNIIEFSLGLINLQFKKQLTPILRLPKNAGPGLKTLKDMVRKHVICNVIMIDSDVPLFDLNAFKVSVRELQLQAINPETLKTIFRSSIIRSKENVKLWNDQLSIIINDLDDLRKSDDYIFDESINIKIDEDLNILDSFSIDQSLDSGFRPYLLQTLAQFSASILTFLINQIYNGVIPEYTEITTHVQDKRETPKSLEELFLDNVTLIEPCINMLREVDPPLVIGDTLKHYKSGIGIWFEELSRRNIIQHVKSDSFDSLLGTKIKIKDITKGSLYSKYKKSEKGENYRKQFQQLLEKIVTGRNR